MQWGLEDRDIGVLVVDDEEVMCRAWRDILRGPEFALRLEPTLEGGVAALMEAPAEVLILGGQLAGGRPREAVGMFTRQWRSLPVVVVTPLGAEDWGGAAIQAGAHALLPKPLPGVEVAACLVRRTAEHFRVVRRLQEMESRSDRAERVMPFSSATTELATTTSATSALAAAEEVARQQGVDCRLYGSLKTRALAAFDRVYIDGLLEHTRGNISRAARMAGLDRSNFRRIMKRARRTMHESV